MSRLWVICGAGRGVGKTHLAQALCEALPDSVYVKLGHGDRQPDKPPNFFHDERELSDFLQNRCRDRQHIVLESNTHARRAEGDIIIYLDEITGQTDVRGDAGALRENADIELRPEASEADWRPTVQQHLQEPDLCRAVCDVLAEHARFMADPRPAVRSKVWFVVGDNHAFGPGLAHLLDGVQQRGSLRASAQAAGMSYRYAWNLIREAERRLQMQLLIRHPGGEGGGGSELTEDGAHMLRLFRRLNQDVARYADHRFAGLYRKHMGDSNADDRNDTTR